MKIIIQRVKRASVTIDGRISGAIGKGLLVFLGVGANDTEKIADIYMDKLIKLRIFADDEGKTNLSVKDVDGELLIVSQFTLYADCKKGNRPSFTNAGNPDLAKRLYEYFCEGLRNRMPVVETGEFGADMKVELMNDGPFTIILNEDLLIGK